VASEKACISALGKAECVASREAVASEEACVEREFLSVVSSADEPSDGDVSQGLDGHDPMLLSHVTPVNPSLRTQSWGDVVSSWDDGVSSNESCVMTELPQDAMV